MSEHSDQVALLTWAGLNLARLPDLALLLSSQNGARVGIGQARKLVAAGLRRGVPDLLLPVARGPWHALWIELKQADGGRVAPAQRWWLAQLNAQQHRAVVCRGWPAAAQAIEKYLAGEDVPDDSRA